jgi:hypothetical protein
VGLGTAIRVLFKVKSCACCTARDIARIMTHEFRVDDDDGHEDDENLG